MCTKTCFRQKFLEGLGGKSGESESVYRLKKLKYATVCAYVCYTPDL